MTQLDPLKSERTLFGCLRFHNGRPWMLADGSFDALLACRTRLELRFGLIIQRIALRVTVKALCVGSYYVC